MIIDAKNTDKRLFSAIDYIDDRFISEAAERIKARPVGQASGSLNKAKTFKQVAILAACLIVLSAVFPIVTYVLQQYGRSVVPSASNPTENLVADTSEQLTAESESEIESESELITEEIHEHDGSKGLIYQVNEDGAGYTLVSLGSCSEVEVTVASTYDGLPVTAVGDYAFMDSTDCEVIILPDSVTSIGEGAFKNCAKLRTLVFSDGVSKIGSYAFENCTSLRSLYLPYNLEVIPKGLFSNCSSLQSVEARNKLRRIESDAFIGCTSLTSLNYNGTKSQWKDNVSTAENWTAGSNIYRIDANSGSFILEETVGSDGLKYSYDTVNYSVVTGVGSCKEKNIVISTCYRDREVWRIGKEAFADCTYIESITLPFMTFIIDERAFAGCTNLKEVYFDGMVDDWNSIDKGTDWNKDCPFTVVHCWDGDAEP